LNHLLVEFEHIDLYIHFLKNLIILKVSHAYIESFKAIKLFFFLPQFNIRPP